MNNLKVGDFTLDLSQGNISISSPGGSLTLYPGEVDAVKHIIGMAVQLETMKVLPPAISSSPWEVVFTEDGLCELKRQAEGSGCKFEFSEGDNLIKAIEVGLTKVIDELRLGGGPKVTRSNMSAPGARELLKIKHRGRHIGQVARQQASGVGAMSPSPSAEELHRIRLRGRHLGEHFRADPLARAEEAKRVTKRAGETAQRLSARMAARRAAAAAHQAAAPAPVTRGAKVVKAISSLRKSAAGGVLRRVGKRLLLGRLAGPVGTVADIALIGDAAVQAYKGYKASKELKLHARAAKKRGYKVTRNPIWYGLLTGDPGIKIKKRK